MGSDRISSFSCVSSSTDKTHDPRSKRGKRGSRRRGKGSRTGEDPSVPFLFLGPSPCADGDGSDPPSYCVRDLEWDRNRTVLPGRRATGPRRTRRGTLKGPPSRVMSFAGDPRPARRDQGYLVGEGYLTSSEGHVRVNRTFILFMARIPRHKTTSFQRPRPGVGLGAKNGWGGWDRQGGERGMKGVELV